MRRLTVELLLSDGRVQRISTYKPQIKDEETYLQVMMERIEANNDVNVVRGEVV